MAPNDHKLVSNMSFWLFENNTPTWIYFNMAIKMDFLWHRALFRRQSGGAIESQSWFLGEMVFSVKQVLWICLVSHLIILASCVKLQDFYPFGQANGDDELPAHGDDTASAVVDLSGSFMLYDKRYRRLSVSSLASSRAESDVEDYGGIFSITRTTSVRRIRRRF